MDTDKARISVKIFIRVLWFFFFFIEGKQIESREFYAEKENWEFWW